MRVGILGSGYEVALIASRLPAYVNVDCYIDWAWWPRTSKSVDDILIRVQQGITHLEHVGVEYMIVPPYLEQLIGSSSKHILPLFSTYMHTVVLPSSRVGKIGIISVQGTSLNDITKNIIRQLATNYEVSEYQRSTKLFDARFPYWSKDCAHRQTHLLYAKQRSRIMRNVIKHDLRYFKDCDVDTLVPLDWGLLYREKMIRHRSGSRIKVHGQDAVRKICIDLLGNTDHTSTEKSLCRIWTTAYPEDMLEDKSWKQLFDWGGKREVEVKRVG